LGKVDALHHNVDDLPTVKPPKGMLKLNDDTEASLLLASLLCWEKYSGSI
jgi:hypothetical protein